MKLLPGFFVLVLITFPGVPDAIYDAVRAWVM